MTNKCRPAFLSLLVVVLCLVGALYLWEVLAPVPGPTSENFVRLHRGMHKEEVIAVLGPPTGGNNLFWSWQTDHCKIDLRGGGFTDDTGDYELGGGTLSTPDGNKVSLREPTPSELERRRRRLESKKAGHIADCLGIMVG